jgi:hypothetical protein
MALVFALPTFAAGRPVVSPVPFPPEGILLPGGVFCDFDLFAEATKNTELAKTFPADENGDVLQIVTGQLWVRLTNVATGESVNVNISGPTRNVYRADGTIESIQMGRLVAVAPGGFFVYSGRVVSTILPDGTTDIHSISGSRTDICAFLS